MENGKIKGMMQLERQVSTTTQKEAADEAKIMLQNSGGGELSIKGIDGKIRSKDTVPPGNDPNPPKDKEH